jgi:hypothetical protein
MRPISLLILATLASGALAAGAVPLRAQSSAAPSQGAASSDEVLSPDSGTPPDMATPPPSLPPLAAVPEAADSLLPKAPSADGSVAAPAELSPLPATAVTTGQGFGRHGPLTPREHAMAEAAWAYFVERYQPDTGLVNAVGAYPSTTLWDTASYISALVSAYELGIIDKRTFDSRIYLLIRTLRHLDLFRGEAPNKVYNTKTAEKVNYANQPGEVGFSVLDIGRLLVWLDIVKERYPYLAAGIDNVPLRWNFCNLVQEDGRLFGSIVTGKGETRYVQEGRLGYEEYAAKGFALWGFDVGKAMQPQPLAYTDIYGVKVPYDGRDPRIFQNQNYVLTEGYLLDGLEMGWNLPQDAVSTPGVAGQGWRAEFANRIYLVQQRRFEQTGILTARSEHQVEGKPYFVYDSIFADGYAWNTMDPSGTYQPDRAAVAAKAAIGMWALWDTPYTDLLFDSVADLSTPESGFYEGVYENGDGYIPLQTANNNGIILAALLYKVQGPILQRRNQNTQFWDVAFAETDIRKNRCLPTPMVQEVSCCACADLPPPVPALPAEDFILCRPISRADGTEFAATDCHPEAQHFPRPQPVQLVPQSCRQPGSLTP